MVSTTCIPAINSTLSYGVFVFAYIAEFTSFLLMIFSFSVCEDLRSAYFLFFFVCLCQFWYQNHAGLIKWIEKRSLLSLFCWKRLWQMELFLPEIFGRILQWIMNPCLDVSFQKSFGFYCNLISFLLILSSKFVYWFPCLFPLCFVFWPSLPPC